MFSSRSSQKRKDPKTEQETLPERILKLKECCDMLLAGGYFRARIPTLSPFDKVVGGVCWSITASNESVEVDVIFKENSTIGQRIKLADSLVKALVAMKCPHHIHSHQIQGLDYDNLFPVIRWLVRKVIETRAQTGDLVRALAVSQFSKDYNFPEEILSSSARSFIELACDAYSEPTRKYKQDNDIDGDGVSDGDGRRDYSIQMRAEATLLEYGEKLHGGALIDEEAEESRRKKRENRKRQGGKRLKSELLGKSKTDEEKDQEAQEAREEAARQERERLDNLKQSMNALDDDDKAGKISGSSVGAIVSLHSDDILKAAADYEVERRKNAQASAAAVPNSKKGLEMAFTRQTEALKRKVESSKKALMAKRGAFEETENAVIDLRERLEKKQAFMGKLEEETLKLDAKEKALLVEHREALMRLKQLVMLNESLKGQEKSFKQTCKQQRNRLLAEIAKLSDDSNEADLETKRMVEIEKIYDNDLNKLNKLRQVLASKNQAIAKMQRQIDEIPTRAELLQYERRFVELYELVALKLKETRKYFAMYNALQESFSYMQQEVKLMDSIVQSFPVAMKSRGGRESLMTNFSNILVGVAQTQSVSDKDYDGEQQMLSLLKAKYDKLLEQQRTYYKAVKEFQDECQKNEKLSDKMELVKQRMEEWKQ